MNKNEKISVKLKEYYSNPNNKMFGGKRPSSETLSKAIKEYYKTNRHPSFLNRTEHEAKMLNREKVHRCRAKKLGLSVESEIEQIKEFYMKCPEGYEVDHVVPFARKGLHSISNLQYLTPRQNRQKGIS